MDHAYTIYFYAAAKYPSLSAWGGVSLAGSTLIALANRGVVVWLGPEISCFGVQLPNRDGLYCLYIGYHYMYVLHILGSDTKSQQGKKYYGI